MMGNRGAIAGLMLLAAVGIMGTGCAGVQVSSGTSSYKFPALTMEELKSAIYPCDQAATGKVTLNAGKYTEPLTAGGVDLLTVTLLTQWVIYGDLDGDGNKDAVAILTVKARGNTLEYHLIAMIDANGTPEARADLLLGDRIKINTVTVTDGKVLVDLNRQGPGDPLDDPRQRFRENYKFDGQQFSRLDQTEIPR